MENDPSINRLTSSDTNTPAPRRKSASEKIEISQLSFFDELLSIGKFQSNIPEAAGLPIEQPDSFDRGPENKPVDETSDEPDNGKLEASADSTEVQSACAVLAVAQQQLPSQPESLSSDRKSDKRKRDQPAENSSAAEISEPALQSGLTTSGSPSAPVSLGNSVDVKVSTEVDLFNSNADLNLTGSNSQQLSIGITQDSSQSKTIFKGKASTIKRESKADLSSPPASKLDLNPDSIQTHSKTEPTFSRSPVKPGDDQGNTDDVNATASQPRNRRSERLAQRASESDLALDDSDSSSASAQSIESIGPLATSETPPDESFLSFTTLVNSSAPTTNFLTQNAAPVSTSHNLTSTNANARTSVEGISAVASTTTRGGIQTNSSVTFSGATTTTSNLARTEQVGGEVARSNPGSRISAYQEVKLVQRVLRGVEQLASGGGQVRLRLHPPELGSLQMSLRMEAGQVFAKLEVENSTARDALLNNIQTLRDRLAEQGMKVASFEVEVGTDSSGFDTSGSNFQNDSGTESQSRWDNATSRFAQQNSNRILSESAQSERKSGAAWTRTNGTLDLTV